jgi:hypothetical protein
MTSMKTIGMVGLLLAVLAVAGFGQTVTGQAPPPFFPVPFSPQYVVAQGVTYDYYGKTGFASSTEVRAAVPGASNLYFSTVLEMTRTQAILRPGAAFRLLQNGNWGLWALGDAGLATGSGQTGASFSGGGFLSYDIGSRLTKGAQHFYIDVGGRLLKNNVNPDGSTGTQPILTVTFGKGF